MPQDNMVCGVNVNVTGTIDSSGKMNATATYTQGATIPQASAGQVVDSQGNINLNNMPNQNNQYSNRTNLFFTISGSVTDQLGNSYLVQLPSNIDSAVTLQTQNGKKAGSELTASLDPNNHQLLAINDSDDNGQTYNYCISVEAVTGNGTPTCPLDPTIVNR